MDKTIVTSCKDCPLCASHAYRCKHPLKAKLTKDVLSHSALETIPKNCPLRIRSLVVELYADK